MIGPVIRVAPASSPSSADREEFDALSKRARRRSNRKLEKKLTFPDVVSHDKYSSQRRVCRGVRFFFFCERAWREIMYESEKVRGNVVVYF